MFLTRKLFDSNPYIKEFITNIMHIKEKEQEFHVVLEQTAFYPEGGGQPCDLGFIDDIPVKYVYEDNDTIFHVLHKIPSKLENVFCSIDWDRRFDHMQQHTGQHILSAAFENLHDAETIGFHLGNQYVTIDLNQNMTNEDIDNVEFLANQIVFNDLSIDLLYPTKDELKSLPLRKKPLKDENIRIVKINDFDYSPCCGTHPNRTGEVGIIKIRKWENYKEGIRVEFVCGNRALKDYNIKNNIVNKASALLSIKDTEVFNGIERIVEETQNLKKENKSLKEKLLEIEMEKLVENAKKINNIAIITKLYNEGDFGELRKLAASITNKIKSVIIIGNVTKEKAQLILSRSKEVNSINIKNIFDEVIEIIEGKGGGNQFLAQGGGKNTASINKALEKAYELIKIKL